MKNVNLLEENGINVQASLELFGDMSMYDETLEDFLSSVEEKLNNIKRYKEVADMSNYAILVHSLKSDSKYLGFTHLADLSYQHEMQSKAGDMVYVYDHYDELMKEAYRILDVITTYLGKDPIARIDTTSNSEQAKKDKTILVVDDSDIIRNLIQKMFTDEFEVLTANDGKEAIDLVNQNDGLYGMLLDLNMPNVNGFAVLEYFKENNLFSKIPVAIITGDDTKETVQKAFTYTIVDVLNKPFNERDVKRVLTAMINFH